MSRGGNGEKVRVTADTLCVGMSMAHHHHATDMVPRLLHGTTRERNHWRFIGRGEGIHWPDLDEDISIEGLVFGKQSAKASIPLRVGWKNGQAKEEMKRRRGLGEYLQHVRCDEATLRLQGKLLRSRAPIEGLAANCTWIEKAKDGI